MGRVSSTQRNRTELKVIMVSKSKEAKLDKRKAKFKNDDWRVKMS